MQLWPKQLLRTVGRPQPNPAADGAAPVGAEHQEPASYGNPNPLPASFRYKLQESIRLAGHLRGHGKRMQIWQHNPKLAGYRLAARCGVEVPIILRESVDIEAISTADLSSFGDRFVVKPHRGAFSRGVHLLVRHRPGLYLDLVDGRERTWDGVRSSILDLAASGRISKTVAIEELLHPASPMRPVVSVPDDWKIYCCYDRPVVVMQRRLFESMDASRWRFRYWTAEWTDLGAAMDPERHGPDLEPPVDGGAIIETARLIGAEAKAAFCRIDLYETDRGVVFGELTPHPGGPQRWRADVDELLGHAWEEAEARLLLEEVPSLVDHPRARARQTS